MNHKNMVQTDPVHKTPEKFPEARPVKPGHESPFETPWKIWNRLISWLCLPVVRVKFLLNGIEWGSDWQFYGVPVIQKHRRSQMHFGDGMSLRSTLVSNPLGPDHPVFFTTWQAGAVLTIGTHFAMTGGTLCAMERIEIGNHVTIGANVSIVDTDFHPVDPIRRITHPNDGKSAPVFIEDNVFIGMNSLVLKGVRIGKGSVIGAGSIVTKNIPTGVIAAGNPARIIGEQ
jgi:acetyltransferase-like isoleucine patch superfamily enzyme